MHTDHAPTNNGIRPHLIPILILTVIFLVNFLNRIVLAPLLPAIEKDLGLSHTAAGSFFLLMSLGYFVSLLGSGFVAARLTLRRTVLLSSFILGVATLGVACAGGVRGLRVGLLVLGLSAGLYFPCGITIVTALIDRRHWGRGLAVHESAPNLSFIAAPLLAETVLLRFSWRGAYVVLGILSLFLTIVYARYGRGGEFFGEPPVPSVFKSILKQKSYWLLFLLFCLAISSTLGIYTMLPLFLVNERLLERSWANMLLAISRIGALGTALAGGWAVDRFGVQRVLFMVMLVTGLLTILLGRIPAQWIALPIILQPVMAVCFFPAGLAALSLLGPPNLRNITFSLMGAMAFLIGGGVVPILIGFIGDTFTFSVGIVLIGTLVASSAVITRFLTFDTQSQ